jgi:hypothetical protein
LVESVAGRRAFPELTRQILSHARFIARKIDDPRRRNNHGLFTAIGLFLVGEAYPEFAASESWRSFGEARVLEEIGLQYSNGAHIERAPTYQKALFDGLVHMMSAYRRQGKSVPATLNNSLQAQRRVLSIMSGPDGRVARFSDSDDHRYLVLAPREYTDGAGSIQVYEMASGIVLSSLPTCAAAWEAAWLRARFERVTCTKSVERAVYKTAVVDTAVGFTKIVLGPWTLIADFAAYGGHADFSGHSHADIGTFELWHEQREVVIDPGTYTYRRAGTGDEFPWRIYFRSSPAHNVILPNGAGQSEPYGEFGLRTWHDASVTTLWSAGSIAIVGGRHVIYDSVAGPSARLFIVQPAGVTVVDWFPKARSQVTYDLRVHTAASRAAVEGTGVAIDEGFSVQFAAPAGAPIKTDIAVGGKPFEGGWRSRHYGDLEEIATARVQSPQSGPAAVVTRIIAGAPAASPAVRSDGTTIEVSLLGGGWLRLDDCLASDPKQQPRPCAPTVAR